MKINFYLDKPYNNEIKPDIIKKELAKVGNNKKNLPNKFFNPNPTSLYLFFSPDKSCRIKYRTNYKILAKNWDFDKERLKSLATGALEFNLELNDLEATCLKEARIKKEKNQYLSKNDYKIIIQECIDRDNAIHNEVSLFQLASKFISYKSSFVKEGTIKEYRTVIKG